MSALLLSVQRRVQEEYHNNLGVAGLGGGVEDVAVVGVQRRVDAEELLHPLGVVIVHGRDELLSIISIDMMTERERERERER